MTVTGTTTPDPTTVRVGDPLPALTVRVTRDRLVRYAGASLDFNPIHWDERTATGAGLPNVIAHGMLTMALAGRVVTDWLGDPTRMIEYGVRFTRPVVVDTDGADVDFGATVGEVREDGTARVDITATVDGRAVLGQARAVVRLS